MDEIRNAMGVGSYASCAMHILWAALTGHGARGIIPTMVCFLPMIIAYIVTRKFQKNKESK